MTLLFVKLGDKAVAFVVEAVAEPAAGGVTFTVIAQLLVILDMLAPVTVTTLPEIETVPPHVFVNALGDAIFKPVGKVYVRPKPATDCPAVGLVNVKVNGVVELTVMLF